MQKFFRGFAIAAAKNFRMHKTSRGDQKIITRKNKFFGGSEAAPLSALFFSELRLCRREAFQETPCAKQKILHFQMQDLAVNTS
ncbi:MAG: hypothetical protein J6T16_06730 [Opitutales bacterium]|nr:hypothetical protein [Opitutales bacterium]